MTIISIAIRPQGKLIGNLDLKCYAGKLTLRELLDSTAFQFVQQEYRKQFLVYLAQERWWCSGRQLTRSFYL